MPILMKNLYGKTPSEILMKYDLLTTTPINISELLEKLNILQIPIDFGQIEDILEKKDLKTILYKNNENKYILYYNENLSYFALRFFMAYQLSFLCLTQNVLTSTNWIYVNGNDIINENEEFALKLLIPEISLAKAYNKRYLPTTKMLANFFKVSENMMEKRLRNFHLNIRN